MSGYKLEINVKATSITRGEGAEYFYELTDDQRAEHLEDIKRYTEDLFRENMEGEIAVEVDVTITEV